MRIIGQAAILAAAAALTVGHPIHKSSSAHAGGGASVAAPSHVVNGGSYGMILGIDQTSYSVSAQAAKPHIHAVLSVFNHTGGPIAFMAGGQQYEWQVVDASGNVVWDYMKGRMFPMFVMKRTLTDQGLTDSYDVPLQNQDGSPLAPGRYTLRGRLTNSLHLAAEIGFVVVK